MSCKHLRSTMPWSSGFLLRSKTLALSVTRKVWGRLGHLDPTQLPVWQHQWACSQQWRQPLGQQTFSCCCFHHAILALWMLQWAAVSWQLHNCPIALSTDSSPSEEAQMGAALLGLLLHQGNQAKRDVMVPSSSWPTCQRLHPFLVQPQCAVPRCLQFWGPIKGPLLLEGGKLQTRQTCFLQSMYIIGLQKLACARPVIAGWLLGLTSATTLPSLL